MKCLHNLYKKIKCNSFKCLLAILLSLSISLIAISFYQNIYSNFELNMGTELFGILIVITVIEWVLKENDKKKWEQTTIFILKKISKFNNKYTTVIREFLNIKIKLPTHKQPTKENFKKFNLDLLIFMEDNILPEIEEKALNAKPDNWKSLNSNLKELNEELLQLLIIFGNRINPDIYTNLLCIQSKLEENIKNYEVWEDIILYPKGTTQTRDSNIMKKGMAKNLKISLKVSIDANKKLLNDLSKPICNELLCNEK